MVLHHISLLVNLDYARRDLTIFVLKKYVLCTHVHASWSSVLLLHDLTYYYCSTITALV